MFLATSFLAIAQEEEEAEKTFVYATYFNCNAALEEAADAQFAAKRKKRKKLLYTPPISIAMPHLKKQQMHSSPRSQNLPTTQQKKLV
jgi:hypothetical protein